MKIALGTTSPDKKNYLLETLRERGVVAEVLPYKVPSGIPEQPLTEAITAQGAKNRAKAALLASEDADIGIGMEGGLELIDGVYHFVAVVAIYDRETNGFYTAHSGKIQLPRYVDERVKKGEEFGLAIVDFSNEHKDSTILSETAYKLMSRKESFYQALNYVLDVYFCSEFYEVRKH